MSQMPFGSYGFSSGSQLGYRSREQELSVGQFFNAVYAWMCVGLATTAVVSWGVFHYAQGLMNMGVFIVAFLAQMALVVAISNAVQRLSTSAATALFVLYSALMGVTLSAIFAVYSLGTIAVVFLETAGLFGAMSVVGFVTKKDLSRLGSLLVMLLVGVIIASVVNMFFASSMMQMIISYVGVVVFVGLTAVDTQRLKEFAMQNVANPAVASRYAIVGSLMLYMDFVNVFIFLLQIMGGGSRRD